MKRFNVQAIGARVCAGVLLCLTSIALLASDLILFDPDGNAPGGNKAASIGGIDWFVGQALVTDDPGDASESPPIPPSVAIPWADPDPGTTKSVQTLNHGKVAILLGPQGGSPTGMDTVFELTYVLGLGASGTSTENTESIQFVNDPHPRFVKTFEIYYDDFTNGVQQNPLTGLGYADGDRILSGVVIASSGAFSRTSESLATFDQYLADDYGIATIIGDGSFSVTVQVVSVDDAFFKDLTPGSLIEFTSEQRVPFGQTEPSANFEVPDGGGVVAADLGGLNGATGPDLQLQADASNNFTKIELPYSCRVTGGGNDTAGMYTPESSLDGWDGTEASASQFYSETIVTVKGNSGKVTTELIEGIDRYTFGGQAGANTGGPVQPKGELSHTNHEGPHGRWTFHGGTASAPPGTEIDEIICSDPGWCKQARPAPTKQIDFTGIGSFRNINANLTFDLGDAIPPECASVARTNGPPRDRTVGTYNWFEVHIEDRGEPGREGQHTTSSCPAEGSGTDAFDNFYGAPVFNEFVCESDGGDDCPDFYRLRIYCGVEPTFDADGNLDNYEEIKAQKYTEAIYEVFGYIDGGNWQIHPPTGFDLKNR